MDEITIVLIVGLFLIALFTTLRAIALWYWRVNESIALQHKTVFLLEKIAMHLGSNKLDEITVEEIKTGKRKRMKIDEWVKYNLENPGKGGYKTIHDDTVLEN